MIGLLDIAGFENFEVNSFEQLCINVSNEQLQYFFNQHIFSWEKKDLENEGVKTSHISFTNNSLILTMFIDVSYTCTVDVHLSLPLFGWLWIIHTVLL